jgi:cell division septation protein DedD
VTALAIIVLLAAAAPARAADGGPLAEAARLEAAGDAGAAARLYREWLRANPVDPRAESAFFSLYRLETALPELFELASLPKLGGRPLLALARLSELSGRTEEARGLYRSASDAGAGSEAMIGWLSLSLAMNDAPALREGLAQLRAVDQTWADVIDGVSELAAGRLEPAAVKLGRAAASATEPRAALAAAWGLTEYARLAGNPAAAAAARSELEGRFPASPEAALAAGLLTRPPAPAQFTGSVQALPEPDLPSAASSTATGTAAGSPRFGVQAGSFTVKENADYLAADLVGKGFAPLVRGESRDGKQVFKVLAGVGLVQEAAEALAVQLSKAGFAGFVISEGR